jgi:hypothetical protein
MPEQPTVSERFILTRDVERYPHFIAAAGSKGTIVEATPEAVSLRLDDPQPGAEEWDNEIVWSAELGQDIWDEAAPLPVDERRGGDGR